MNGGTILALPGATETESKAFLSAKVFFFFFYFFLTFYRIPEVPLFFKDVSKLFLSKMSSVSPAQVERITFLRAPRMHFHSSSNGTRWWNVPSAVLHFLYTHILNAVDVCGSTLSNSRVEPDRNTDHSHSLSPTLSPTLTLSLSHLPPHASSVRA